MSLTHNDVIAIMKLFRESQFNNLHLKSGDFKLVLSKDGQIITNQNGHKQTSDVSVISNHLSINGDREPAKIASDSGAEQNILDYDQIAREGWELFKSPMLGVFYSAPKPGEPPFVQEGALVGAGDTLCIIEVMKLYSTITAEMRGRIVKICVEDGQMVEYEQPLFLIDPKVD